MPSVADNDYYEHNDFGVPGGGPYNNVVGTPTQGTANPQSLDAQYLLCNNAAADEYVEYAMSPTVSRGWNAYYFRVNTGEEPAGNATIQQIWTTGYGQAAKVYYLPGSNELSITVADVGFSNLAITLDAWHWCEFIFDVSGTTHSIYGRVDGVDFTPQSDGGGGSAAAVQFIELGARFSNWTAARFSHYLRGTASSTSDWLGDPASVVVTQRVVSSPMRW